MTARKGEEMEQLRKGKRLPRKSLVEMETVA